MSGTGAIGSQIPLVESDAHPFNTAAPATSDATGRVDTVIPAGTPLARFATRRR